MATHGMRRWLAAAMALAAVAIVVAWMWPTSIDVEAAPVRRGRIADTVADQGIARARQAYVVSAPVAGRVERLPLEVGDRVVANTTLVARIQPSAPDLLDPRERVQAQTAVQGARAALTAAIAQRDRLAAEAARTRADLRRTTDLAADAIVTRQALENAQSAAEQAAHALEAADADILSKRAAVATAEAVLSRPASAGSPVAVTSPASGAVTRVFQQSERTVTAGMPLIEISDTTGLEAAIEFLTQEAVRIRPGQRAEVYDWGGGTVIDAEVRRVEPQGFTKISALGVEEQRTVVVLQFSSPLEETMGLAPGFRVWGRVYLRVEPSALLVPVGSLIRHAGAWAVYVLDGGRATLRDIRTGIMTDDDAQVLSGLKEGETVIVYPSDLIRDGVRARARRD